MIRVMCDSGAYSAFQQSTAIDLREYAMFLKQHRKLLHTYISLDVIGVGDSPEQCERAAKASRKNHQKLKDAGLSPMPVFHRGERWHWLELMLNDGEQMIGLAPHKKLVGLNETAQWLHDCFLIIADAKGQPRAKVHLFGSTAPELVRMFPWTSVDATTWLRQSGFGVIPVPRFTNGQPDYLLPHWTIAVSKRSASSVHLYTLPDWQRHAVDRYCDYVGLSITEAIDSNEARWRFWVKFLVGLQQATRVAIVFGADLCRRQRAILNECGATHALLSYFKLRSQRPEKLAEFINGPQLETQS